MTPAAGAGLLREEQGELHDAGDGVAAVPRAQGWPTSRRRRAGHRRGAAPVLRPGRARALPWTRSGAAARHILDRVRHGRRGGEEEGRAACSRRPRPARTSRKLASENSDDPGSKSAGRRPRLGDARELRAAVRGRAVRHAEGRDPRPGEDPVRLPRHPARGRAAARTSAASTRCAPSSRPTIAREQAQSLFYEKSQQLADDPFASLSELDSVAKKLGLHAADGRGLHAQGRRAVRHGPQGDRRGVQRRGAAATPEQPGRSTSATTRWSCCGSRTTSRPRSARSRRCAPEIEANLREQGARKAAEVAAARPTRAKIGSGDGARRRREGRRASHRPAPRASAGRADGRRAPRCSRPRSRLPRPAPGKVTAGPPCCANGDVAVFAVSAVRAGDGARPGRTQRVQLAQIGAASVAGAAARAEFDAPTCRNSSAPRRSS